MIPGISSGMAAPLYAGIPVTHRNLVKHSRLSQHIVKSKEGKPILDWKALANGIDTIAFYMGVANLSYICQNLMANGKSPETPIILIQWGTFSRQKTLEGTLATIADLAVAKDLVIQPLHLLVKSFHSGKRSIGLRKNHYLAVKFSWLEQVIIQAV